MATNDFNGTQTLYASKDPLAGLHAPKPFTAEEFDLDAIDEQLTGATEDFSDCAVTADKAETLRKVIVCHGCGEYAFDGTLTAYEAEDEGAQPFCGECVAKIEKRSRKPQSPTWWNDWNSYKVQPLNYTINYDSSKFFTNSLS